jgi:hypothetical protein
MSDPIDDRLDWFLAPRSIDPRHVALILQSHMHELNLDELEALVADFAARDGYRCDFGGMHGSAAP